MLDKTGTITEGRPAVTDMMTVPGAPWSDHEMLQLAASLEASSEHPVAEKSVTVISVMSCVCR